MIRVLLAEDTAILRDTLVAVLNLQDDLEVVAEVGNGDHVIPAARGTQVDVAILDIDLPGRDGLTVAEELRGAFPDCGVLILTAHANPANLRAALEADVAGFLPKDTPATELILAIRKVAAGSRVVDSATALAALNSTPSPLTEREREVLRLHAEGLDPREIATAVHLSYGTVRNYLASASVKLNARNRIHAIKIASENGWL